MHRFDGSTERNRQRSDLAPAKERHVPILKGAIPELLARIRSTPQSGPSSGVGSLRGTGGWAPGAGLLVCVWEAKVARSTSLETTRMWETSAGRKPPQFDRVLEVSIRCRELTEPNGGIVETNTVPSSGSRGGLMARRMVAEMARERQISAAARRALVRSSMAQARSAAFSSCPRREDWPRVGGPAARFVIERSP